MTDEITTNGTPDWTSFVVEECEVPFSSEKKLRVTYRDPMLRGYEVLVVADTVPAGASFDHAADGGLGLSDDRLTTLVCRFPRCVLSEVNTHRVFSRNSASSRARAVKVTIGDVMENPYIPLFTMNSKGMAGAFATPEVRERATEQWLAARDAAVVSELRLLLGGLMPAEATASDWRELVDLYYDEAYQADEPAPEAISVHKQNANRIIEPFMWHEAVITSTYWRNFLEQRDSDQAQPEIHALAVLVREALRASQPRASWVHIPFVDELPAECADRDAAMGAMMDSAAECARISYKDRSRQEVRHGSGLGDRLLAQKHLSPFEHAAFSAESLGRVGWLAEQCAGRNLNSNLSEAWVQLRHVIAE